MITLCWLEWKYILAKDVSFIMISHILVIYGFSCQIHQTSQISSFSIFGLLIFTSVSMDLSKGSYFNRLEYLSNILGCSNMGLNWFFDRFLHADLELNKGYLIDWSINVLIFKYSTRFVSCSWGLMFGSITSKFWQSY